MRTYAVTGAASGIGKATKDMLEEQGHRVIGIDLRETEVIADLSTREGLAEMVTQVADISGGRLDGVLAIAGLSSNTVATAKINYFGMVGTLEGLRPLLEGSPAPRAVAVASMALMFEYDAELARDFESGDEAASIARAEQLTGQDSEIIYSTTKRTVARWVRRQAPSAQWAGKGIALNAIAPGLMATPMMARTILTEERRKEVESMVPMPLNGIGEAEDVARALIWLTDEHTARVCGQVIFVDGGSDAVIRGDGIFAID